MGLLIPAEGDPLAFIFKHEVKRFTERACLKDVAPYGGVKSCWGVSGTIREKGYRRVGFDVSVKRDAYESFF